MNIIQQILRMRRSNSYYRENLSEEYLRHGIVTALDLTCRFRDAESVPIGRLSG